jgi:hypothetical protein
MSVWCSGRGGFARGIGHGFEPRQPRSVATLREKMRDLRLGDGDGWLVGRWGLSYKKSFFRFLRAAPENLSAGGWLKRPPALGLYAGGRTTASTETICDGTRSLAGAPPASKDPFYPPAQIVCGLVEALCRAPNKTHGKKSLSCILFSDARQWIFAVRFNFGRTTKIFFLPPLLQ